MCESETHFTLFWHHCYDDDGDDRDIYEDNNGDFYDDSNSNVRYIYIYIYVCVCVRARAHVGVGVGVHLTDPAPAQLTISATYLAFAELWNFFL